MTRIALTDEVLKQLLNATVALTVFDQNGDMAEIYVFRLAQKILDLQREIVSAPVHALRRCENVVRLNVAALEGVHAMIGKMDRHPYVEQLQGIVSAAQEMMSRSHKDISAWEVFSDALYKMTMALESPPRRTPVPS